MAVDRGEGHRAVKPDSKRSDIAKRSAKAPEKIKRDAFLYMVDHDGDGGDDFAQCSDCRFFAPNKRCAVLGITVKASKSCGMFADGEYTGETIEKSLTPEEAGLVDRKVRCENCFYGGKTCGLYDRLNKELPALFDLDSDIDPKGCCNANTPK